MEKWWDHYPWRLVQTNFREIDMQDMDADAYVEDLKKRNATVVLMNAAGIIASYDTDLEFHAKSKCLGADSLEKVVEKCHEAGIKVIARTDFSKINQDIYEKHPEWAYRSASGEVMNYNGFIQTCPNGGYQQEYQFTIIEEMFDKIPFDGIFCNFSGFSLVDYSRKYYGPCNCNACRKEYRKMYGEDIPALTAMSDPSFLKYMRFTDQCNQKLREKYCKTIRAISEDILIEGVDYIRSEAHCNLGIPTFRYSASSSARVVRGISGRQLSDNSNVDFMDFPYRDISVSREMIRLRHWQNIANSGNLSFYIMGGFAGHRDRSAIEATTDIYAFHKAHEAVLTGMRSAAKVLLLRNGGWGRLSEEEKGWISLLTQSHIPFDEAQEKEFLQNEVSGRYDVILIPAIERLSSAAAEKLNDYVEAGGRLITIGKCSEALKCLGIKEYGKKRTKLLSTMLVRGENRNDRFSDCRDMPYIAIGDTYVEAEYESSSTLETYFHIVDEHPFGPPEISYFTADDERFDEPGVTRNRYGLGEAVFVPWYPGTFYCREGFENTGIFMRDVLFDLAGLEDMAPGLSEMVEITINKTAEGDMLLSLVNESGVSGNNYVKPLAIRDISLRIRGLNIETVQTLSGANAAFTDRDGVAEIQLEQLKEYEGILVFERRKE